MKQTDHMVNGWYIVLGINIKGRIGYQKIFDKSMQKVNSEIKQLTKSRKDLTYFTYKIKETELL